MSDAPPPPSDEPLRVDRILEILPRTGELRPLLDLLVASSRPDPERRWSGSGELGTVGERVVDPGEVAEAASTVAKAEAERLAELYRRTARLVDALASDRREEVVALMLEQGESEEAADLPERAEAWYRAAYAFGRHIGSGRAPEALRKAARTARAGGALERAALDYEEAWREAGILEENDDRTVAAIGRGNVAVDRGRWDEADTWYRRALDLVGREGAPRPQRWQILQNLAIVRRRRGDLEGAREALVEAEREAEGWNDPDAAVEVANGWGQLLLAEGDPRAAELHFKRAREAATSPEARIAVAVNLGEALLAQGRILEAGEIAREAEADALASRSTRRLPEVYRLLASVARMREEGEAFVILERALRLVRERDPRPFEEAQTLEAYGKVRLERGEEDAGVHALEAAARIYDELGMEERSAEARRLATAGRVGDTGEPTDEEREKPPRGSP